MQRPEVQLPIASVEPHILQVEIQSGLTAPAEAGTAVWSGTAVPYSLHPAYTPQGPGFGNSTHVLS